MPHDIPETKQLWTLRTQSPCNINQKLRVKVCLTEQKNGCSGQVAHEKREKTGITNSCHRHIGDGLLKSNKREVRSKSVHVPAFSSG